MALNSRLLTQALVHLRPFYAGAGAMGAESSHILAPDPQVAGDSFNRLMQALPAHMRDWGEWFVPCYNEALKRDLRQDRSRAHAPLYADSLVPFGLTPAMFIGATKALAVLFDQSMLQKEEDCWHVSKRSTNILRVSDAGQQSRRIPIEYVFVFVASTPGIALVAAYGMLNWLLEAVCYAPGLIPGYEYRGGAEGFARLSAA